MSELQSPQPPEGHLSVLVVDDDAANRLLATRWLERAGLSFRQAESGEQALRVVQEDPRQIGVILLDVMMPSMSGYEVLERLQREPASRDIPVIVLTAHAGHDSDVVRSLQIGAIDHLFKPFRGPVLVAKLQALLERRRAQLSMGDRLSHAEALATTDALTGVLNRRQFDADLARETLYTLRHETPLALVLVDIDGLKQINDELGHAAGDRAIVWTAQELRRAMRRSDRVFRLGGDEFGVILRGSTRASAFRAAERLVNAQAARPLAFTDDGARPVLVSAGVAAADDANGFDVEQLFERADRALYAAKSAPAGARVQCEQLPS
jgi:two-component system cell cycle response regulator